LLIATHNSVHSLDVAGARLEHRPKQISVCKMPAVSTAIEINGVAFACRNTVRDYNQNAYAPN